MKWLCDFQIVACMPLSGKVSIDELALLADVSRPMLSRVVRMTATAGFLQEPEPGYVAHTTLSSLLATESSYLDAADFLTNNIAPSSMHLTSITPTAENAQKRNGLASEDSQSAFTVGLRSQQSFARACIGKPQLSRQWLAYCQSYGAIRKNLNPLLGHLNWQSLGQSSIVHVSVLLHRRTS